ncbi:MAG: hypothetical protein AAGU19_12360 [Prolixibacteraceae bacterium]
MKRIIIFYICITGGIIFTTCTDKTKSETNFPKELVQFFPFQENPVFKGTGSGTWDQKIRERGFILYDNGLYKMWYTGYNPEISQQKFLGYATSNNGIHWNRYPGNPVFTDKWTEDMFVIKDDDTYYMYAEGDRDVAHLLISDDGINWQEKGDLMILSEKGDTISGPYGTPSIWIEDGQWYLFYERNDMGIWIARSTDKITWRNIRDEPVLALGPEKYDIGAIAANQVIKNNGRFYMYYHATDCSDWNNPDSLVKWTSNVAMSTDLTHWIKYPGNPILEGDFSSPILVFDGENPSLYSMHPEVCRYTSK